MHLIDLLLLGVEIFYFLMNRFNMIICKDFIFNL